MLILARSVGKVICITVGSEEIEIRFLGFENRCCAKLGINASKRVEIRHKEKADKIKHWKNQMLVVSQQIQKIIIIKVDSEEIEVCFLGSNPFDQAKMGLSASKNVKIHRKEIADKIKNKIANGESDFRQKKRPDNFGNR